MEVIEMLKLQERVDWKELYSAPRRGPVLVDVPEIDYLMVDGHGDPERGTQFQDAVQAMFSVAYTIKFDLRNREIGPDFKVSPLEALWWSHGRTTLDVDGRGEWQWRAMTPSPLT